MWTIEHIPDARIRAKIRQADDCWIWTGSLNNNGYGHFVRGVPNRKPGQSRQKKSYVHRYVFTVFKGPIPPKHEVHHSCYNRPCCNPKHLSAITHEMNVAYNRQII